jgi:hypothetical protein
VINKALEDHPGVKGIAKDLDSWVDSATGRKFDVVIGVWVLCYLGFAPIKKFLKWAAKNTIVLVIVEPHESTKARPKQEKWFDED